MNPLPQPTSSTRLRGGRCAAISFAMSYAHPTRIRRSRRARIDRVDATVNAVTPGREIDATTPIASNGAASPTVPGRVPGAGNARHRALLSAGHEVPAAVRELGGAA